jgi:GNAT superfamily N-acetyltransferase
MIRPITRQVILEGTREWTPCYMFGISKRGFQCSMWLEIFDEVGGIGYVPYVENKPVGQMIFLPKEYARRIGFSTCRTNEDLKKTMVIGCLFVVGEHANQGIASAMIEELIGFCREHGYARIEAPVDPRPPDEAGINISFYPFRKFGFVLDEATIGWEFRLETRMCFCDLSQASMDLLEGER